MTDPDVERDINTLSWGELKAKYQTTFNSWKDMKYRRRIGAVIDPEFATFKGFLGSVGPRPTVDQTLDRIDNTNPRYGPGLVRWLDKRGQANNRATTRYLSARGERLPLTVWAERTGQRPSTIRSRLGRGYSDERAVFGPSRPDFEYGEFPAAFSPWPLIWPDDPNQSRVWEAMYWRDTGGHMSRPEYLVNRIEERIRELQDRIIDIDMGGRDQDLPERELTEKKRLALWNIRSQAISIKTDFEKATSQEITSIAERKRRTRNYFIEYG